MQKETDFENNPVVTVSDLQRQLDEILIDMASIVSRTVVPKLNIYAYEIETIDPVNGTVTFKNTTEEGMSENET